MRSSMIQRRNVIFNLEVIFALYLIFSGASSERVFAQQVFSGSGSFASYAIDASGDLYVWGEDEYLNTIATSMTAQDLVPVKVAFPSGVTRWVSASAGIYNSLALGNDGNIYAWGSNVYGQLGNGTTTDSNTPVKVQLPNGITATSISSGYDHGLAIGSDGNVYAWGANSQGQLGDGTTTDSDMPVKVNLPSGFVAAQIYASWNYSFAIGTDGSLYAWGTNAQGQLGLGNTTNQLTPVKAPFPTGVSKWTGAYGGIYFAAALGNDGNLYESGYNQYGQLGNGTATGTSSGTTTFGKAIVPSGVSGWKGVACTGSSVLALGSNDTLYAWGYGGSGEMGNSTGGAAGATNAVPVEVAMPSGVTVKSLAANRFGGLVAGSDNYYYAWGQGTQGQLGNGGNASSYGPVRVIQLVQVPPQPPTLLSPANAAVSQPTSLTFKWSAAREAAGYQFQLSYDPTFATDIIMDDSALTDTTLSVTGLGSSTKYYWRVRSYNNGVLSAFTNPDSFSTVFQAPSAPVIISPADNAVNMPAVDTLLCSKAAGASKYNWQITTDPAFSSFFINDSTNDTLRIVTLSPGTKYYWRVRAINMSGASSFAGPDSFAVMAAPSGPPNLIAPLNNSVDQRSDTLVMTWRKVTGASGYECQLSLSRYLSSLVAVGDSTADTSLTVTLLQNQQKYYWRVRAYNAGGTAAFSQTDSFTTVIAAPRRPHIISPFTSTHVMRMITFEWDSSATATSYHLQVSTDNLFRMSVVDTTVSDTSVRVSTALEAVTVYYWRVSASNAGGSSAYSVEASFTTGNGIDAVDGPNRIPTEFSLAQNYPNPFNPTTTIQYEVPRPSQVIIRVYDVTGREVETLVDARETAGKYSVLFDGSRFASGMYFVRMTAGSYVNIKKMMLVK